MADLPVPDPIDDGESSPERDDTVDPDHEAPIDVSESDRFAIRGRDVTFSDFIQSTMSPISEREPIPPEPQPSPQEWDIIWAARRPLQPPRDTESS